MKKIKILIAILSISHLNYAQNQEELDSLGFYFQKGSSFLYTNADSTKHYLSKSIKFSDKLNDIDSKLTNIFYLIASNGYFYNLNELSLNLNKLDSILTYDRRADTLENKAEYVKNFLIQKGNYNFKIRNYNSAKENFQELLDIILKEEINSISLPDRTLLFSTYNYLASINQITGKNGLAQDFYEKSLLLGERYQIESFTGRIAGTKVRLAKVFENKKEYYNANKLLKESLFYYIQQKDNPRLKNNLLSTYQRLSKNYLLQDSITKAISILKESEVYYSDNDAFQRSADLIYGDIYTTDKQFDTAETFYHSYLSKTKIYRQDQKHQDIAEAFSRLGRLYVERGRPKKALEFYQESLMQLAPNFEHTDSKHNPDPQKVVSKLELVKVLKEKLEALQLLYKKTNQERDLTIAVTTSHDIINTIDLLKPEFESKVDKQFLISELYPAFHRMVEVAYDLYTITQKQTYIDNAFYFIEKSKSILLLEAARNTQASSFGDVPRAIIDQEQQYRANIIHLEKKLFNQKSNTVLFDSLFTIKNSYYSFIAALEQQYPKYHDLKYNTAVVPLDQVQHVLGKDSALISYFATDKYLFVVTSEKGDSRFYKIPFHATIKNRIQSFYEQLSVVSIGELENMYATANLLYTQLLEKPLQEITAKKLLIIPDDMLNYLPFEALSTSDKAGDYLIHTHQISYSNSVTLMQEQSDRTEHIENKLIAYAPVFRGVEKAAQERSEFGALLYNTQEAKAIANFFDGKVMTGDEASLHSFTENVTKYSMLHFATHAAANDEFPDYSYLAFTGNDTAENELLYVKDLYGYNINADLVTLSACQTGLGKLQKGEGMLSLARGFKYAGARSLVTTLWKINDQTTSQLMENFYKNLSNAATKDSALRQAKLAYLSSSEDELLKHPYYWSGFMISGDMSPLTEDRSAIWWWLLCIPVLIIVYRKLKKIS